VRTQFRIARVEQNRQNPAAKRRQNAAPERKLEGSPCQTYRELELGMDSRMCLKISSALGISGRVALTRLQRSRPSASTSRVVSRAMSSPSLPALEWTKPYVRITRAPGSLRIVNWRSTTFSHTKRACSRSSTLIATTRIFNESKFSLCRANSRSCPVQYGHQ
jgi:hypothetical protein